MLPRVMASPDGPPALIDSRVCTPPGPTSPPRSATLPVLAPPLQVTSIRYSDGKAIGVSLHKGDAGLHCVDLTRMRPFSEAAGSRAWPSLVGSRGRPSASGMASTESSLEELSPAVGPRMRFSEKHGAAGTSLRERLCRSAASQPAPATCTGAQAGSNGACQPAAAATMLAVESELAPACQRRQAAVLGPRTVNLGPTVEVFAPDRHPTQPASFTAARPAGATALSQPASARGRASPGNGGKGNGRLRLSAEENGDGSGTASRKAEGAVGGKAAARGVEELPAGRQLLQQSGTRISMLDPGSHRSFLGAQMQRSQELQDVLQAKQGLWRQVTAALHCGQLREAVRLLKDAGGGLDEEMFLAPVPLDGWSNAACLLVCLPELLPQPNYRWLPTCRPVRHSQHCVQRCAPAPPRVLLAGALQ